MLLSACLRIWLLATLVNAFVAEEVRPTETFLRGALSGKVVPSAGIKDLNEIGACGEGLGDHTTSPDALQACRKCYSREAVLVHLQTAEPLGFTRCYPRPLGTVPFAKGAGVLSLVAQGTASSWSTQPAAAAPKVAAPSQASNYCGDGIGDLLQSADVAEACARCGGHLVLHSSAADGLGFTSCSGSMSSTLPSPVATTTSTTASPCGEGVGDLRDEEAAEAACLQCKGPGAFLDFDVQANDGAGFTSCMDVAPSEASNSCGEGIGDSRQSADAAEACARCGGQGLVLDLSAADGLGFTFCEGAVSSTLPASSNTSASSEIGSPCGEDVGDLRNEKAAVNACLQCKGPGAYLDWDMVANDGAGFTSCKSAPSACGQGGGDLRGISGAENACIECGGTGLAFDPSGADGFGATTCQFSPSAALPQANAMQTSAAAAPLP